jgi:hypothetical protein
MDTVLAVSRVCVATRSCCLYGTIYHKIHSPTSTNDTSRLDYDTHQYSGTTAKVEKRIPGSEVRTPRQVPNGKRTQHDQSARRQLTVHRQPIHPRNANRNHHENTHSDGRNASYSTVQYVAVPTSDERPTASMRRDGHGGVHYVARLTLVLMARDGCTSLRCIK